MRDLITGLHSSLCAARLVQRLHHVHSSSTVAAACKPSPAAPGTLSHIAPPPPLLPPGKQQVVSEDAIEACCEMITIAGKTLAATSDGAKKLDGYTEKLDRFCKHPSISVRVRFLVKDIQELKRNKWVPRRETFTAKKLDEVHAEAEAELGMISSRLAGGGPGAGLSAGAGAYGRT
jgi:hypothetical protein